MTPMTSLNMYSNRSIARFAFAVALTAAFSASARADSRLAAAEAVAQGKQLLEAGKYDDALDYFKKAEVDLPDSAEIAYDRGIALYRKAEFDKAKDAFMNALRTREPALEAKSKFNLGNCAYSTALQKLTDLSGAIDELRKAITYWRDSLDLNPEDAEARQNIETAQLLIKDLLDKEKKRQEEEQKKQQDEKKNPESQPTSQPDQKDQKDQQQQDQQQKDQQKQDQQNKDQQNKDKQKNDQQKNQQNPQQQKKQQPKQDPKDQKGKDKDKEKQKQEEQKKKDQQQQREQAQMKRDQMSREDAERKLQAIRDKERARREDKRKREATEAGRMPVDRDW